MQQKYNSDNGGNWHISNVVTAKQEVLIIIIVVDNIHLKNIYLFMHICLFVCLFVYMFIYIFQDSNWRLKVVFCSGDACQMTTANVDNQNNVTFKTNLFG